MAIQIMPTNIEGFDGLDNMFNLKAADDEGNIGLDILTTVTADEWPEISDAILRGLMLMCPGSEVRFGQASIDDLTRQRLRAATINEGVAPANTKTFDPLFKVGDTVEKISGYKWPGIIVAVFNTIDGKVRIVVECTVSEVRGALHIYNPDQLIVTARKR